MLAGLHLVVIVEVIKMWEWAKENPGYAFLIMFFTIMGMSQVLTAFAHR